MAKKEVKATTPEVDHVENSAFTDIIRTAAVVAAAAKLGNVHGSPALMRVEESIGKMSDKTIAALARKFGMDEPQAQTEGGEGLVGVSTLSAGGVIQDVHNWIANIDPAVKQRVVDAILSIFGI